MQNFRPVVSAEYLGKFIHDAYVRPARARGDRVVTIRVREVCEALSHGYSENLVRGVLGSMKFRNAYRLPLVAGDEHADGPSRCLYVQIAATQARALLKGRASDYRSDAGF